MLEKRASEDTKIIPYDRRRLGTSEPVFEAPVGLEPPIATAQPSLGAYWHILLRRRWTILSIVAILTTLVAIASFKMKPIYRSTASVEVDSETGIVKVMKMVAVQDCGLVVDLKTAESQCYGALIMGISYSLYEEKVMDATTGRMLNADMQFYRLAGLSDIPELVVHMMTGKGYDERGVIGLGEPPVISPGAAISNAVANAIGVRVPFLPLTPDRVLTAMEKKEGA